MRNLTSVLVGAVLSLVAVLLPGPAASAAQATQTIVVRDAATGAALASASVVVEDGAACYSPKATSATGSASFVTNGIRSIRAAKAGYADCFAAPQTSFTSFTVSLKKLPTKGNSLVGSTAAYAKSALKLAQASGAVSYLGTFTLSDLRKALDWVAVGSATACIVFPGLSATPVPEACKAFAVAEVASAGLTVAQALGLPMSARFKVYCVGQSLLVLPA